MHCDSVPSRLVHFLHGELSPGEMRAIQIHLRGCLSCRREMQGMRRVHDVVAPLYFIATAHGEVTEEERTAIEQHVVYCESCREERQDVQAVSNELIKNLSQYELSRNFRLRVMQEWKPHRIGRRHRYNQRGLADLIERAEGGNTFSYERHVDKYKDYAYIAAFLEVRDFHWAAEIARRIFTDGMPVFKGELTQAGFLKWLRDRSEELSKEGGWLGVNDEVGDTGDGLSGYAGSRKLRRHRLVVDLHAELDADTRMPFLLFYAARLSYSQIGELLEMGRVVVLDVIERTTRHAMHVLEEDDRLHPRRRKTWER